MSIVDDQIRHLDALLDKFELNAASSRKASLGDASSEEQLTVSKYESARTAQLKNAVRALSTTSNTRPLLKQKRVRKILSQIRRSEIFQQSANESELEWLATGKATVQVYGILLNSLLDQTIPLSESIWYWDDILGSYLYTGLYTLQTSPLRFWNSVKEVYHDAKERYRSNMGAREAAEQSTQTLGEGWKEFYGLVQQSIEDRSLTQAKTRILSPFAICRTEARRKQNGVRRLREQSATAIGLLVDEGLIFSDDEHEPHNHDWRITVAKSISLLEGLLKHGMVTENSASEFEELVIDSVDQEAIDDASQLTDKLEQILDYLLPEQQKSSDAMALKVGKPSRLIRYWIPGLVLLVSGGTLLRMFTNRKEAIATWFRELGITIVEFCENWVVEPAKKLFGTIRHDENSELAIMSRDSLRTDRESLERMVIEFAMENPQNGTAYTEAQITDIRNKVKEGDVTPVLRAYEADLQRPVRGALFGNLVRALLIQVQKTKVDVEIAMNGIDEILKSQELLFGFVGVAPGLVISYLSLMWLRDTFGNRRGMRLSRDKNDTVRLLRNIDRTLSNAIPTEGGLLGYKDHGLLLCEIHVLRQRAAYLLPGNVQREFLEDLHDLMYVRQGIQQQMKVVSRIQWAYGKWLK